MRGGCEPCREEIWGERSLIGLVAGDEVPEERQQVRFAKRIALGNGDARERGGEGSEPAGNKREQQTIARDTRDIGYCSRYEGFISTFSFRISISPFLKSWSLREETIKPRLRLTQLPPNEDPVRRPCHDAPHGVVQIDLSPSIPPIFSP